MECKNCKKQFSANWINPETGEHHNLCKRQYCLECSPFKLHNTSKIINGIKLKEGEKACPKCKILKQFSEFYFRDKSKTSPSSFCKLCMDSTTLDKQRLRKQQAVEYLGGKCQRCGYSIYIGALEFHHRDPNEKDFAISSSRSSSMEKMKPELDKCELLCSNCHKEVHNDLYGRRTQIQTETRS